MPTKLLYIELKTGYADNGPAWIGLATLSRSGRCVYFNGKALKRIPRGGISGNHEDIETGEEYWVSGVKKQGLNRHRAGGGKVLVEAAAVEAFLEHSGGLELDSAHFQVTHDITSTDISKFVELENSGTSDRRRRARARGLMGW